MSVKKVLDKFIEDNDLLPSLQSYGSSENSAITVVVGYSLHKGYSKRSVWNYLRYTVSKEAFDPVWTSATCNFYGDWWDRLEAHDQYVF